MRTRIPALATLLALPLAAYLPVCRRLSAVALLSFPFLLISCGDGGTTGPEPAHTLTVTKAGTGSGTVTSTPAGIDCGSACSASYGSGTTVTLTATAATGSTFGGWSGGGCSGTGTCQVTMDAAKTVTATFLTFAGTWPATLGNGRGSFTFVVSGTEVTSLWWSFWHEYTQPGGGYCKTTVTCPEGAICATPTTATITGMELVITRDPHYSLSGTFSSADAVSGSITYTITSDIPECGTTQTTTWTANRN